MPYHTRFTNFHEATLDATDRLFKSRPWRGTSAERSEKFVKWLRRASAAYDIPVPRLHVQPLVNDRGVMLMGAYDHDVVVLSDYSVLTMFHEFRHHMQAHYVAATESDKEDDAVAWSCSLFHTVRPELFREAVMAGRVAFVEPADLLSACPADADAPPLSPAESAAFEGLSEAFLESLDPDGSLARLLGDINTPGTD